MSHSGHRDPIGIPGVIGGILVIAAVASFIWPERTRYSGEEGVRYGREKSHQSKEWAKNYEASS